MGKTSSKVRNRWNKNSYDAIGVTIPKGMQDKIREYAKTHGMSVNGMINMLLRDEIGILKIEWGFAVGENPYCRVSE